MNPRRFSTVFAGAVAVLSAFEPSCLLAADWGGQNVSVRYVNDNTPTTFSYGTFGVGGGTEIPGNFSIDLQPVRIVIDSSDDLSFGGPLFNGFTFELVSAGAPSLVSAMINGAWPVTGLDGSRLATTAVSVSLDLNGLLLSQGSGNRIVIDLNFESVPEASTWAAWLIAIPAAGCWLRRRMRRA